MAKGAQEMAIQNVALPLTMEWEKGKKMISFKTGLNNKSILSK
jgi:hypothetical protein